MTPFTSVSATLLPLVTATVEKLFPELVRVTLFAAPAASVVTPATVSAPLCVIAPFEVTPSVPPTVEAPKTVA